MKNPVHTLKGWWLIALLMLALTVAACAAPTAVPDATPTAVAANEEATPTSGDEMTPTPADATPVPADDAQATPVATPAKDTPEAAGLYQTYLAIRPAASGEGSQIVALRLHTDGTAELATRGTEEDLAVSENGTWQENGDGTITVTLTEKNGEQYDQPVVITFALDGDTLTSTEYQAAADGEEGLSLRAAANIASEAGASLFTMDLSAGFPLDPTFISVNGGGAVDAGVLGSECRGYINEQPVVAVNWTGAAEQVRVFFYSNDDPTLVILAPDGKVYCNDDVVEDVLDPSIELENPPAGRYEIWVGSYAEGQLIPGVLVFTTKPEITAASFSLDELVARPPLPENTEAPRKEMTTTLGPVALLARDATLKANANSAPLTASVTAQGEVPAFEIDFGDATCNGFLPEQPDYTFEWSGQAEHLRVYFEGDADATLLVLTPDQTPLCNDDAETGVNVNPLLDIPNPTEGVYTVYVGRVNPDTPVVGALTVTSSTDTAPAVLAPVSR